ncbi:MAG: hypothetical protein GXO55_08480 [Chloroflexi bacterium]|nr:hypothetical protein [Chloroflexota bacterium]
MNGYTPVPRGHPGFPTLRVSPEDRVVRGLLVTGAESLLVMTNRYRLVLLSAGQLPDARPAPDGASPSPLMSLEPGERVVWAGTWPQEEVPFWLLVTRHGWVRRFKGRDVTARVYENSRLRGISEWWGEPRVFLPVWEDDVLLVLTRETRQIHLPVRIVSLYRELMLSLQTGDEVAGGVLEEGEELLLLISAQGRGVRHRLPVRKKSGWTWGWGQRLSTQLEVAVVTRVRERDEVFVLSEQGRVWRLPASEFPVRRRVVRGTQVLQVSSTDAVVDAVPVSPVQLASDNGVG